MGALRPHHTKHSGKGVHDRRAEEELVYKRRVIEGATVYTIHKETGLTEGTIYRRLDAAMKARIAPLVDEYRKQQNDLLDGLMEKQTQQLDAYERAVEHETRRMEMQAVRLGVPVGMVPVPDAYFAALAGRQRAVDALLRVSERRAKLNGLDAPIKVEATVTEVSQADIALQEMVAEAKAKWAAAEQQAAE